MPPLARGRFDTWLARRRYHAYSASIISADDWFRDVWAGPADRATVLRSVAIDLYQMCVHAWAIGVDPQPLRVQSWLVDLLADCELALTSPDAFLSTWPPADVAVYELVVALRTEAEPFARGLLILDLYNALTPRYGSQATSALHWLAELYMDVDRNDAITEETR